MNRIRLIAFVLVALVATGTAASAQSEAEAAGHEMEIARSSGKGQVRVLHPGDRVTVYGDDGRSYEGGYVDADSHSVTVDSLRFSMAEIDAVQVPARRELQADRTLVRLLVIFSVSIPGGWLVGIIGFFLAIGGLLYDIGSVLSLAGVFLGLAGMVGVVVVAAALIVLAIGGKRLSRNRGWIWRPGRVCPKPGAKRHP